MVPHGFFCPSVAPTFLLFLSLLSLYIYITYENMRLRLFHLPKPFYNILTAFIHIHALFSTICYCMHICICLCIWCFVCMMYSICTWYVNICICNYTYSHICTCAYEVYLDTYIDIFLNIIFSLNILLIACMCSGLTIWHSMWNTELQGRRNSSNVMVKINLSWVHRSQFHSSTAKNKGENKQNLRRSCFITCLIFIFCHILYM